MKHIKQREIIIYKKQTKAKTNKKEKKETWHSVNWTKILELLEQLSLYFNHILVPFKSHFNSLSHAMQISKVGNEIYEKH